MGLYNYHTHNGYYRGTGQEWTPQQGWNLAKQNGIELLGIANKVEFNHPNQDFIPIMRADIDELNNKNILLGVELDIGHPSGQNVLKAENLKYLDFVIGGPHNTPIQTLTWKDLDEEDLTEYFQSLRDILVNSFKKCSMTIWAHPFLQEIEYTANKYWEYISPILVEMLEICVKKNIAIEINENFFRKKTPPQPAEYLWASSNEYYKGKMSILKKIFTLINQEYDLDFTYASDSHKLEAVPEIDQSISFAREIGIKSERFLRIEPKK
jgi:histidinol phosphatase-like PHP family hydrolase